MDEAAGLRDDELDGLYGWLAGYATLLVAVSGGPDSLALMESLARWARRRGAAAPRLEVGTVDHGLRPGSVAEARLVADIAARLGLPHCILRWSGAKPTTAIQETARQARYLLLAERARQAAVQPAAIVTAHHAEDQAETVLMRLARGSGVDGLAAMAPRRKVAGVALLRPLLAIAKARLVATVTEHGLPVIEDPSNNNVAFERVRLRRAWPALQAAGLSAARIGLAARRLERARQALETATDELARRAVDDHGGVYATIDMAAWRSAPEELRIRLLARSIAACGGQAAPSRLSRVEKLATALTAEDTEGVTLGGCFIVTRAGSIEVMREPGRDGFPEMQLQPGAEACWDRRFQVRCEGEAAEPVVVRALGAAELARLRAEGLDLGPTPVRAAVTLPSFWQQGRLIGVPHLVRADWPSTTGAVKRCSARFLGLLYHECGRPGLGDRGS